MRSLLRILVTLGALLLPQVTFAASVPKSLALKARYVAQNGGILGHRWGEATPQMKILVKRVIRARFANTPDEGKIAVCIAYHESGLNPGAISDTDDWGSGQINRPTWSRTYEFDSGYGFQHQIFDPAYNSSVMYNISRSGTNWGPWTTRGYCT